MSSKPTLRGFALKFTAIGGILYPSDHRLHALAIRFAEIYISKPVNFADYESVTITAEIDDKGEPVKVTGLNARVPRWDYPLWRFIDERSGQVLIDRTRSKLDDEGQRGGEVFVYLADNEDKTSRCPKWKKFLRLVGAEKASRWRVKI